MSDPQPLKQPYVVIINHLLDPGSDSIHSNWDRLPALESMAEQLRNRGAAVDHVAHIPDTFVGIDYAVLHLTWRQVHAWTAIPERPRSIWWSFNSPYGKQTETAHTNIFRDACGDYIFDGSRIEEMVDFLAAELSLR